MWTASTRCSRASPPPEARSSPRPIRKAISRWRPSATPPATYSASGSAPRAWFSSLGQREATRRAADRSRQPARYGAGSSPPPLCSVVERERRQHDVDRDQREALEHLRLAVAGDLPDRDRGQEERADVDRSQ